MRIIHNLFTEKKFNEKNTFNTGLIILTKNSMCLCNQKITGALLSPRQPTSD